MKRKMTAIILVLMLAFGTATMTAYALPEGVPDSLEAPVLSNLEQLESEDGVPYFRAQVTVPQSVLDLDSERPTDGWVEFEIQGKIDNDEWGTTGGGGGHLDVFTEALVPGKSNTYYVAFDLEDEGSLTETVINARTYTYKVRFNYTYYYGEGPGEWDYVYSAYSNEIANKSSSFYNGASSWAVAELDKAQQYGFITDRIKGNMAGKVTREEFAEIAVKLYEKYTGAMAVVGNAEFTDTTNPEILKAANLGLVQGIGNGKYGPSILVTREQMATILQRALQVMNPAEDFSNTGVNPFSDDGKIKSWAKNGVYYCAKTEIVTGVGSNMYNPEGSATREQAVIVCTRAYEYYEK